MLRGPDEQSDDTHPAGTLVQVSGPQTAFQPAQMAPPALSSRSNVHPEMSMALSTPSQHAQPAQGQGPGAQHHFAALAPSGIVMQDQNVQQVAQQPVNPVRQQLPTLRTFGQPCQYRSTSPCASTSLPQTTTAVVNM
jgi:hypothetical protein